jgi:HD superfamily phosphohydrolase
MENMRVIDDEICFRAKEARNVYNLFQTRADLHRTVYTHPKVKALELMMADAFLLADNYVGISQQIHNPEYFWKLDDSILKSIETSNQPELEEARQVILRIRRRQLYQFCNEYSVPKEMLLHFKDVTAKDIICAAQTKSGVTLREEDVVVSNQKIDLTRGQEDPVKSVRFFKDYDSNEKFTIPKERISHLLPSCFIDRLVRVYAKKPELVEAVSDAFENFQVKTYGIKAQVHGTPDGKKKRRIPAISTPSY